MKKIRLLLALTLSLLTVKATNVTAAAHNDDEENISAGGFLFHFNRDNTALTLWWCNNPQATMTLPDKVYYDIASKTADLHPFGDAKAYKVEKLEERTFRGNADIRSVTLPASYSFVGSIAFKNCPNLTTFVSLGKDVMFDNDVFAGCKSLENVTIDANQIGSHIFDGCDRLVNPHITGSLDHIPDAAFKGTGIKNLDFLPQSVTLIWAGAFSNSKLEGDFTIPQRFSLILNEAFAATNIRSLTVSEGFDEIKPMVFAGCTSLTTVSLPQTMKTIGGASFANTAITEIYLPNSVIEVEPSAFFNCFRLDSIHLPDHLKKLEVSTFNGTALKRIYLPASLESIERGCFQSCPQLTDIYCFAITPPTAHQYSFSDFDKPTVYVPAGSIETYKNSETWKKFKKIKEMPASLTGIAAANNNLQAFRMRNAVRITGMQDGSIVQIYTTDGQLINKEAVRGSTITFSGITARPIIIKVGDRTLKLK